MSEVTLEPALPTEADARRAMAWRNDPHTRLMSFHREPRLWDDFWADYLRWMSEAPGPVFAWSGGLRVGFLRFASMEPLQGAADRWVVISINIAPEARGRGMGLACLVAAEPLLGRAGVSGVYAEVRTENTASMRMFEAAGYASLGEAVKHVDTGEAAAIVRYLRSLDG
jgi:N-acetylneuraminate synthase